MRPHRILACVGALLGAASCFPSSINPGSPEDLSSGANTTDALTVTGLLNGTVPSSFSLTPWPKAPHVFPVPGRPGYELVLERAYPVPAYLSGLGFRRTVLGVLHNLELWSQTQAAGPRTIVKNIGLKDAIYPYGAGHRARIAVSWHPVGALLAWKRDVRVIIEMTEELVIQHGAGELIRLMLVVHKHETALLQLAVANNVNLNAEAPAESE